MIGRERERNELLRRYRGNRAEFIAVYGRRRVGKTFRGEMKTGKPLWPTMISFAGVQQNMHRDVLINELNSENLFE